MSPITHPQTAVPADEEPAATCPYCDRPFREEGFRDLHLGEAHATDLTPEEQATYETAVDEEDQELFLFHLRVVAGIAVIYSVFVILFMVVLS